jgi:hypothetical protein
MPEGSRRNSAKPFQEQSENTKDYDWGILRVSIDYDFRDVSASLDKLRNLLTKEANQYDIDGPLQDGKLTVWVDARSKRRVQLTLQESGFAAKSPG